MPVNASHEMKSLDFSNFKYLLQEAFQAILLIQRRRYGKGLLNQEVLRSVGIDGEIYGHLCLIDYFKFFFNIIAFSINK